MNPQSFVQAHIHIKNISERIIFQDENIVVVDKPCGWLTVPSRDQNDARSCVGIQLQELLKTKIYPVHRLDEPVSGLVVFALNSKIHKELNHLFENHLVQKNYLALTSTKRQKFADPKSDLSESPLPLSHEEQIWTEKIVKGKKRSFVAEYGQEAITHACVEESNNEYIRWNLFPKTGRSHQLRLALARRGYPIYGDILYGDANSLENNQAICLRAVYLEFQSSSLSSTRFDLR